jgi:hypothetical protein
MLMRYIGGGVGHIDPSQTANLPLELAEPYETTLPAAELESYGYDIEEIPTDGESNGAVNSEEMEADKDGNGSETSSQSSRDSFDYIYDSDG